ncbi:MAG: hypothetical protein PHP24_08705 [Acidithiobacillus sp.]|nr:hypothetical protein [Acidithiobacillus sp.]
MMLNNMGQWELSNLPSTSGPSTISDGPGFYYFTNPNNTPVVDSVGDVTANLPAPALPVAGDNAGILGISSSDMVKASDIAAALAPVLTTLAGLTPAGRAAIVGGSALWSMYANYYNAVNPPSSSGSGQVTLSCGSSVLVPPSGKFYISNGMYDCYSNGSQNPCDSPSGFCYALPGVSGGICPVSNVPDCSGGSAPVPSGSSSGSAIPAPTLAQVANMLANNATNSVTALQNLPASTVQGLRMTSTLTGPSTATGPATTSTSTDSAGNTTTTTTTPTYNMSYSGPDVAVTTTNNVVTQTCTSAGTCTTTNTTTLPVTQTPFVGPPVNFGSTGLTAALQGMQTTVPFSSIGFGSSWLPQSCPPEPSWPVSLPFGFNKTFSLPTNVLCTLASDTRPFVLTGGGVLSLMILAW